MNSCLFVALVAGTLAVGVMLGTSLRVGVEKYVLEEARPVAWFLAGLVFMMNFMGGIAIGIQFAWVALVSISTTSGLLGLIIEEQRKR